MTPSSGSTTAVGAGDAAARWLPALRGDDVSGGVVHAALLDLARGLTALTGSATFDLRAHTCVFRLHEALLLLPDALLEPPDTSADPGTAPTSSDGGDLLRQLHDVASACVVASRRVAAQQPDDETAARWSAFAVALRQVLEALDEPLEAPAAPAAPPARAR